MQSDRGITRGCRCIDPACRGTDTPRDTFLYRRASGSPWPSSDSRSRRRGGPVRRRSRRRRSSRWTALRSSEAPRRFEKQTSPSSDRASCASSERSGRWRRGARRVGGLASTQPLCSTSRRGPEFDPTHRQCAAAPQPATLGVLHATLVRRHQLVRSRVGKPRHLQVGRFERIIDLRVRETSSKKICP
jgi:hypothetical protein